MTLEELKAEIKCGVDLAGAWNWNYDEALALIARVEEVVKEMREDAEACKGFFYLWQDYDKQTEWASKLEGKDD